MNKGLALFLLVLVAVPLVGCEEDSAEPEAVADEAEEEDEADEADETAEGDEAAASDEQARDEESLEAVDFEYPGVDLDLTAAQLAELAGLAEAELCPCEDSVVSLHECMQEEERCEEADQAAQTLIGAVSEGGGADEAFDALAQERAQRTETHDFVFENVPYKGNPEAEVVIVEFADFSCGECRRAAGVMEQVLERFGDDVVIYFKNFPLGSPAGQLAAQASMAAHNQGRFWEMHDLIFENQRQISRSDVEQHARRLGLNFERFQQDMESRQVTGHIARDRAEGEQAGVMGTPTVYVNGERYTGIVTAPALSAKVQDLLSGS